MDEGDDDRKEDSGRQHRRRQTREMVVPVAAVGALLSSLAGAVGGFQKSGTLESKLDMIVNRITAIEITVAKMGTLEAQNADMRDQLKDLEARLRQVEQRK